jgi:hypothetical protein
LFNRFVPPKHPFNTGMFIPWAKDVERVTEGRVKVKFTTVTLAPPPKQWNMIAKGIADVAMLANAFEKNRLTLPPIAQLPFAGTLAESRGVALWRTYEKYLSRTDEYKGIKLLGLWTTGGNQIYHGNKPIRAVSDLKNEKMWGLAMIFLTVPIFVPLVEGLGFDLIWFGIVMVMVLEISLITPPIGLNVFVIKSMLPGVPLKTIFKGIAPFFYRRPDPPCLVVFIPSLALWLPSLVFGRY